MARYGVTDNGFIKQRMPDIRADIITDMCNGLGHEISTGADTTLGVLFDIVSERISTLWECAETVYNSIYPGTASGMQLDRAVSFTGVKRQSEAYTTCPVLLRADDGTLVPAGTQFRSSIDGDIYALSSPVTVSAKSSCRAVVRVNSSAGGTKLGLTINSREYSFTPVNNISIEQAVKSLTAEVAKTGFDVSSADDRIVISTGLSSIFSIAVTGPLSIVELWSVGDVRAIDAGQKKAPVNDIQNIVTAVNGLHAVNNIVAATPGRLAENDSDLRLRYPDRLYRLGSATERAIAGYLQDSVHGISNIRIYSNRTDSDENGMPPRSVRVVVEGGDLSSIGQALLGSVAAGTKTIGGTEVVATDSHGEKVSFYIDRPERVYIWVSVKVGVLPPSEAQFPTDGLERIAQSINAMNTGVIGQDVVWGRIYSAVFATEGIAWITCRMYASTDPAKEPTEDEYIEGGLITINPNQIADFDLSRIKVFT